MIKQLYYTIYNYREFAHEEMVNGNGGKSVEVYRERIRRIGPVIKSRVLVNERDYIKFFRRDPEGLIRLSGDSAITAYFPLYDYSGPPIYALDEETLDKYKWTSYEGPVEGAQIKEGHAILEIWNTRPYKDDLRCCAALMKEYLILGLSDSELTSSRRKLALMHILSDTDFKFDRSIHDEIVLAALGLFDGDAAKVYEWLFRPCYGFGMAMPADMPPESILEFVERLNHGLGV